MKFNFIGNSLDNVTNFDIVHSFLDAARLWFGRDAYALTYDYSNDIGMINPKVQRCVVKDYINLTKNGDRVGVMMKVLVESGEVIDCSSFCLFETEEQAKTIINDFTKMGKDAINYTEELPL